MNDFTKVAVMLGHWLKKNGLDPADFQLTIGAKNEDTLHHLRCTMKLEFERAHWIPDGEFEQFQVAGIDTRTELLAKKMSYAEAVRSTD